MDDDTQLPGSVRPGGRTARTRERVLEAVSALLLEEGYDGLTVDAVAARSGVHRATVYRRWRDVGGLLADTVDAARELPWEPPDTGSLIGDLIEINRQVAAALTERPSIAQALIAASFRSPAAATALRTFWEDRYARAAIVVTRAADTRAWVAADGRAESRAGTAEEHHVDAVTDPGRNTPPDPRAGAAPGKRPATAGAAGTVGTALGTRAGGADVGVGGGPVAAIGGAGAGAAIGGAAGEAAVSGAAGEAAVSGAAGETAIGGAAAGAAIGGAGAGAEARSVIVAACAPLFYELALMRNPAPADIAERYARMAAAQFLSRDEVTRRSGYGPEPGHGLRHRR